MIQSFYCDPHEYDSVSQVTTSGFFIAEWFSPCENARMALKTPGIDGYDEMLLLDDRSSAQIQVVVPGGHSIVATARRSQPVTTPYLPRGTT